MQIRNTTKIPKEIRIQPEKKQQIIDGLRLKYYITRMEYQKIINLLDNETTQQSKLSSKNWVELKDDSRGTYDTGNQI